MAMQADAMGKRSSKANGYAKRQQHREARRAWKQYGVIRPSNRYDGWVS